MEESHFEKYSKYYLIAIITFAFIVRLYFFLKFHNQALWWDEADYLSLAKNFVFGTPEQAPPWRAWGIAVIYAPLYWLGANETIIKFLEVLFSTAGVYLCYLVGKEFFNKKVGLLAALFMTTFWVHLFWTTRIEMGIVGLLFWVGAALFFYKGYVKDQGKKYIILSGILIGIGIFVYEAVGFIIPFLALYIILTEKYRFVLNKKFYIFIAVILLAALPFLIANQVQFDSPYPRLNRQASDWTGEGSDIQRPLGIILNETFSYFTGLPQIIQWGFLILLVLGLTKFTELILTTDILLKNPSEKQKKDLFILLWPTSLFLIIGILISTSGFMYEERFTFPAIPIIFSIAGYGVIYLYNKISSHAKEIAVIVIIALIAWPLTTALISANKMIELKSDSFYYERPAGEWIKQNTNLGDTVLTCSQPVPLTYYAERNVLGYNNNNLTDFEEKVNQYNVKYLVIDMYFYECNPSLLAPYESNLVPVQVYFLDEAQTQPIIMIFEIKNANSTL